MRSTAARRRGGYIGTLPNGDKMYVRYKVATLKDGMGECLGVYRLRRRRRTKPAKPINPLPSRVTVPGSGTTVAVRVELANPVCGPQFVPEAVQKWIARLVN